MYSVSLSFVWPRPESDNAEAVPASIIPVNRLREILDTIGSSVDICIVVAHNVMGCKLGQVPRSAQQ